MAQIVIGIIFLILHIACCVLIYLGIRSGRIKTKMFLMPVVIFIPVFGPLCVAFLHFEVLLKASGTQETGLEKLKSKTDKYQSLVTGRGDSQAEVVSLEEALLINDAKLRRNMIMDVLNSHPEEYVELLDKARMNGDSEVVHYATTAMSELFKEYDARLQEYEQAYAEHPNRESLNAYCNFLGEYIDLGIVQGTMERARRFQYIKILKKRIEEHPDIHSCIKLIESQIVLKDYNGAQVTVNTMGKLWPEREEYWMERLHLLTEEKKGKEIANTLKEMQEKHIYLSAESESQVVFWEQQFK